MNSNKPDIITYTSIGYIQSPNSDPDRTPIQPCYSKGLKGCIVINPDCAAGLQDLESFSHIVVVYHFDRAEFRHLTVKPYLHDLEHGVFATRSPHRPNRIGISVVELERVEGNILYISRVDMLDGTPVLDIKPYISRFDYIEATSEGWQDEIDEETAARRGRRIDKTPLTRGVVD